MSNMKKDYVKRLEQEYKELKIKLELLNCFIHENPIFKTLPDIEQIRMIKQCGFMESYRDVLKDRINAVTES
jgi:hypothetical protein